MKAWTGTRPSRFLRGRGWDLTEDLSVPAVFSTAADLTAPVAAVAGVAAGLPAAAQGLPAAAQGLPAAAHGLPAAAHPQQLHKGVVVAAHEGRFHKSLLAATTAVALTLFADLPGAARGPLVPAHP